MQSIPTSGPFHLRPRSTSCWLLLLGVALTAPAGVPAGTFSTNLTWKAGVTVKETYDSNVYLQDEGDRPAEPDTDSFVTSVQPRLGLDYKPCTAFHAGLSYTPDIAFYHSAHSEDYVAHAVGVNFSGSAGKALWELKNSFLYIDGSREGPTFARPGDVPAVGGIPLRNRRAAFVFRNSFRATQPLGEKFIVRPTASVYVHDFKTRQRTAAPGYVYENYVDRQDISGGIDGGYRVTDKTTLLLGYRYGRQDQYKLMNANSPYDCAYHRILVGVEGAPADWLKLNVSLGPDIRHYSARRLSTHPAYSGFDENELLYYVDASVSFLPTKRDTITLTHRRYQQPAFSSFSVYEDITCDITYRHAFSPKWTAGAGFTLYIGDWQAPVGREDWIYTPSAFVAFALTDQLAAEASYSYDWVDNRADVEPGPTAFADGREYTRHLVSLGLKYTF
ncbi:MAG: hypothetical protein JXQ71_05570 [Verrucomicrobia bacterium]|nr:hypothetical protein [Verrucomicrobiota bacterium]